MDEPLAFSITFFSFLILLRTSLVIHGRLVFFFTVKVGMHLSAAASNKSLTLFIQCSEICLFKVVIFPCHISVFYYFLWLQN